MMASSGLAANVSDLNGSHAEAFHVEMQHLEIKMCRNSFEIENLSRRNSMKI